MKPASLGLVVLTLALLPATMLVRAQRPLGPIRLAAQASADLRQWDAVVDRMAREGELRLRASRPDTLLDGREHERFDQYYKGVRVYGADVTRQLDRGQTVSVYGVMYDTITIETGPTLQADDARARVEELSGVSLPLTYEPELVVLPREEGGFALAYQARAFGARGPVVYFIDARTGALVHSFSDLKSQAAPTSAVGIGTGVHGDRKKMSVSRNGSEYRADDQLRPPRLVTFDLKGDLLKAIGFLTGVTRLSASDQALDTDNTWSDGPVVDAHAYVGWVYDYFYKQFGRRGLDNRNIEVISLVHPVDLDDFDDATDVAIGLFYLNAFYAGDGVMVFGEGLPPGRTDSEGRRWTHLSGALDVVAHELTHGVTDYSSGLIYENESGALNETFSDVIGTAVEFYFQPRGNGPLRAEYLMGEDATAPSGIRSAENPGVFGDPDHYSQRYVGRQDNGGVHINSTIGTHAYYLAIEGGTNRTSGLSVTGVGAANREQITRAFYRAFTQMMPANSNFSTARAATVQAARDLFGATSAPVRALSEAWTAVGVE